ncbi:MAG: YraN family protein [Acidiferrobacterales bacterium]|nr:YraN family protein [Acidiferrobacterales bacterium]
MKVAPTKAAGRGKAAEEFAEKLLIEKGFRLLERNYFCKGGELDLVMMDRDELVFVEVRYRGGNAFVDGGESVDRHKQRKLRIAAESWLSAHESITFRGCRFDVMSISGDAGEFEADWIVDAF